METNGCDARKRESGEGGAKRYLEEMSGAEVVSADEGIRLKEAGDLELVNVVIFRDDVEAGNIRPALESLEKMRVSEARVLEFRGSVDLSVNGYGGDGRELFEIPEVCEYFKLLVAKFPYLFWFVAAESPTIAVIAGCVCGAHRVGVANVDGVNSSVDKAELTRFLKQQFAGLNKIFEDYELDRRHPTLNKEICVRVLECLGVGSSSV